MVDIAPGEDVAAVEVSRSILCTNVIRVLWGVVLAGSVSKSVRPSVVKCDEIVVAWSPLPLGLKGVVVRLKPGGRNIDGAVAARPDVIKELSITKINRSLWQYSCGEIRARTWLIDVQS